jgi:hypothetical protein
MATASQLAAQGINPKYQLPDWARAAGRPVDLKTSPYWGAQDTAGGGTATMGNGDGTGYYQPLEQWAAGYDGNGDSQAMSRAPNPAGATDWLNSTGQQVYEAGQGEQMARWLQDANGNITAEPMIGTTKDRSFTLAALAAGGLVGGAAAGLYGGAGAGAASGAGAMTAEQVAMLAANGLTDAQIAAMATAAGDTAMAASLTGAGMGGAAAGGAGTAVTEEGIKQLGTIAPGSGPVAPITPTGMEVAPTIGKVAVAGGPGMLAGDWIQLAGLGAGLIQSNNAQNSADAFAGQTAQQAADMLAFSKAQYADSLPYIKAAQEKSLQVSDAQLASMKQQDALAKEYADYNRTTFRPLEQGIVANAQGYDTPEKRQSAADQALADVNMQFGARNAATARQLAASGVAPGSAKSMAVLGSQGVEQARVGAGAAQQARKGVETTGIGLRADAANMGRNLPSAQATSASLGIQAGNSAVNNSMTGANASTGQAGQVLNTMNATGNMNLAAGRLQQSAQDAQTQLWGQLGQAAGRWTATSDVNMKEDIEPADSEQALQQVTSTPVSNWKYSPAKMAAQGLPADDAQHTGPMAQDVNATMGEKAAPGGKKIDLVSMNGKTMLAVQALDRKINTLAQMLAGGRLQAGAAA